MNILELLNLSSKKLKYKNIHSYKLDSEILISKILNKTREEILINLNTELNYNQILIQHDSASVSQFLIKSITNHNKNIKKLDLNIMPDLRGYSKREAVFHLENKNIIVVAKGTGKVVSQSIKVGKKVYAGQEVILNFL